MDNINIKSADDLAALVAANPSCQSPFKEPNPNHSAGMQMQNGARVHISNIETDEQIAYRMAQVILNGHFSGNPITKQDLARSFSEAEIQICINRTMQIVRADIARLKAKGIRRVRVKAGSSRSIPAAPSVPPKPNYQQTAL